MAQWPRPAGGGLPRERWERIRRSKAELDAGVARVAQDPEEELPNFEEDEEQLPTENEIPSFKESIGLIPAAVPEGLPQMVPNSSSSSSSSSPSSTSRALFASSSRAKSSARCIITCQQQHRSFLALMRR